MRRRWIVAGVCAAAAVVIAHEINPWPRIWLLRLFSGDGSDPVSTTARLVDPDIHVRRDVPYGDAPEERLDVYRHAADRSVPALIWVHGGGFVAGSKEPLRPYLSVVASHGFASVNVEYTPAPEAGHPTQIHQVVQAVQYVIDHADQLGIDPNQLVLGGDSAGAHIVSQAALAALDHDYGAATGITAFLDARRIAGLALASGPFDLPASYSVPGFFRWYLRTIMWAYTGARDFRRDPRFEFSSITQHVRADFPPTFLTSGPRDALAVQTHGLAEELRRVGADVEEVLLDKASPSGHVFDFDLDNPDARLALRRLVGFLRRVTTTSPRRGVSDAWPELA